MNSKKLCIAVVALGLVQGVSAETAGGPLAESTQGGSIFSSFSQEVQSNVEVGWRSRYVTQGVDNMRHGGIYTVNPSLDYKNFNFAVWYAYADRENFRELDLVLSYPFKFDKLTITPIYQHFFFYPDDSDSAVPALVLEYQATDWLVLGADANVRISDGRGNGYYTGFARATWQLCEKVSLVSSAVYGINGGYVGGVDEGSNTMDFRMALVYQPCEKWRCLVSANYNHALSSLRDANLGGQFWYGVRFSRSF